MSQIAGRLSIIQACAYDDTAMTSELRDVLGLLGTYSDQQGYCYPSQSTLGERLGILRESVNRRIRRLADLGYVEIEHQFSADGGKRPNRYRLVLDFRLPQARWRIPPAAPDQDSGSRQEAPTHVRESRTTEVREPHTSEVREPRTTLNDPIERPSVTTTHKPAAPEAPAVRGRGSDEPGDADPAAPFSGYDWLPRHPLYQRAATLMPPPTTRREVGRWAKAIAELAAAGAAPDDLSRRAREYVRQWPRIRLTVTGLAGNWSLLEGPNNGSIIATRAAEQVATERAAAAEARRRDKLALRAELEAQYPAAFGRPRATG